MSSKQANHYWVETTTTTLLSKLHFSFLSQGRKKGNLEASRRRMDSSGRTLPSLKFSFPFDDLSHLIYESHSSLVLFLSLSTFRPILAFQMGLLPQLPNEQVIVSGKPIPDTFEQGQGKLSRKALPILIWSFSYCQVKTSFGGATTSGCCTSQLRYVLLLHRSRPTYIRLAEAIRLKRG